jgi:outer membrane protein W
MLRKFFVVAALMIVPAMATTANAQFKAGDFELTLGGNGANNRGFTAGSFGVAGSIGYFFTPNIEVALRQSANYSHPASNVSDQFLGSTRAAIDYNFDFGKFVPYVGVNGGYNYGTRGFTDTWEVAPEAGIKFFLNSTTFLLGQAEYQILFHNASQASFNRGSWVYSIGLGLRL